MSNQIDVFNFISHSEFKQLSKSCLKRKENLIVRSPRGCGKTQIIEETLDEEYGKDGWAYFSGPTMDPFIDFIGCPKEREEDGLVFLDLVRPKRFATDSIHAIFIDEYNRAPKHVKNAVMELIQKGTINGQEYKNLKVVWAAINPDEDEYDVEPIDLAQLDRFPVKVSLDSKPSALYFETKYGTDGSSAVSWWDSLNKEVKQTISPRTLETALIAIRDGMNPSYYLPNQCKPSSLSSVIKQGPIEDSLKKCDTPAKIKKFLANEKNFNSVCAFISKKDNILDYLSYAPKTKIARFLTDSKNLNNLFLAIQTKKNKEASINIIDAVIDVYESGKNKDIVDCFNQNPEIFESLVSMKESLE